MSSIENNYRAALADCEKDLAGIDAELAALEEKRAKLRKTRAALLDLLSLSDGSERAAPIDLVNVPKDAFSGLSIIESAKKYLTLAKSYRPTRDITNAFLRGGFKSNAKDFRESVRTTLRDARFPKGPFVWHDEKYGLVDWNTPAVWHSPQGDLRVIVKKFMSEGGKRYVLLSNHVKPVSVEEIELDLEQEG